MDDKSLIIIGAGISGLAAGCYARMNGYQTKIVEMHSQPGGFCTAWKRKGYTFDFCIHDLAGAGSNSALHHIWQELGALQDVPLVRFDEFWRVENASGKPLMGYRDVDHLELHLLAHSSNDRKLIRQYINGIRHFDKFELFALQEGSPKAFLAMVLHLPALIRWSSMNMADFAEHFEDPFLRTAFKYFQYGTPETPLSVHMNFAANAANGKFAWPAEGSLAFTQRIARRYESLGGELILNAKVDEILVDGDQVAGVRLTDGRILQAGRVISTADGMSTIYHMLDGQYTNRFIERYYQDPPDESIMNLVVSLGVRREIKTEPRAITLLLDKPHYIGDRMRDHLDIEIMSYEPSFAPHGCTSVKVVMDTAYHFWDALYQDRQNYEQVKQLVAEGVLQVLEKRFPGLSQQVEVVDVATPKTIERYTGNYHGCNAWFPKKGLLRMMLFGLSRRLPGLKRFYMAGQWSGMAVGLHTTAISSRQLIQRICKEDGQAFKARLD